MYTRRTVPLSWRGKAGVEREGGERGGARPGGAGAAAGAPATAGGEEERGGRERGEGSLAGHKKYIVICYTCI